MSKRLSGMNKLLAGSGAALALVAGCSSEAPAQAPAPAETSAPAQPTTETCSKLGAVIGGHEFILGLPDPNYLALTGGDAVKAPELEEDAGYIAQHFGPKLSNGTLPQGTVFEVRGLSKKLTEAEEISAAAVDMPSLEYTPVEATEGRTFTPPEDGTWTRAYEVIPHMPVDPNAPCVPKFVPSPGTSI